MTNQWSGTFENHSHNHKITRSLKWHSLADVQRESISVHSALLLNHFAVFFTASRSLKIRPHLMARIVADHKTRVTSSQMRVCEISNGSEKYRTNEISLITSYLSIKAVTAMHILYHTSFFSLFDINTRSTRYPFMHTNCIYVMIQLTIPSILKIILTKTFTNTYCSLNTKAKKPSTNVSTLVILYSS